MTTDKYYPTDLMRLIELENFAEMVATEAERIAEQLHRHRLDADRIARQAAGNLDEVEEESNECTAMYVTLEDGTEEVFKT